MEYITTRRIKHKLGACGQELNIPRGTKFESKNDMILDDSGRLICFTTSQIGHECFARNNDGMGLRRGALTYAIAFSTRARMNNEKTRRQRFTDKEIETLETKWSKFLVPDIDVILFNHNFFEAEIMELEHMATEINIKVKE